VRRRALVLMLAGLVVLPACRERAAPSPPPRASSAPGNGWNVLLLTVDTLRADHLGAYGYRRPTSPHIDALASRGTTFDRAYTFWPKTRASFVMMLTGRRPSQNGYSHRHPQLLDFNPTLASVLKQAGYVTAAVVDNANVAKGLGYAKGFDSYREIWEQPELKTEWEGTQAITQGGLEFLRGAKAERPFFLWLHYVNPHAPYEPPAPYDKQFLDAEAQAGPKQHVVSGFRGGIPRPLYVPGQKRVGYYVAQYDGEIAAVDQQLGLVLDALAASPAGGKTLVVLASDHGESLGEHDYYFDHGEDLFEPCLRIPLIVAAPGGRRGQRSDVWASTLDVVPTVLDAVKVPYPPDLGGESLFAVTGSGAGPKRERLFAQNDRNLMTTFDGHFKLVAKLEDGRTSYALYDRASDPGERKDVAGEQPEELRRQRRELELFVEATDREWAATRRRLEGAPQSEGTLSREACDRLQALGYVDSRCGP